jgi:hypothetical protein
LLEDHLLAIRNLAHRVLTFVWHHVNEMEP